VVVASWPSQEKSRLRRAAPLIDLLLAAIAISLVARGTEGAPELPVDALAVTVIIVMNAVIGYMEAAKADATSRARITGVGYAPE
jgi:hypothetical protein